ncbi:hypothetical protein ACIBEJ_51735 [Nonomuraea sp. NPDC050790]|uniref:hypothetical protein n=1 Tax=Nonomuraea sp. NPDC050790 TaxID=3364371 RepID=UPI0037BE15EB
MLALILVVVGVLWFFLADPLDLPDKTLEALDKRASVISMLAALVFGSVGWWLQRRSTAVGSRGRLRSPPAVRTRPRSARCPAGCWPAR